MKRVIIILLSIAIQFLWLGGIPNNPSGISDQNSKTSQSSKITQTDTVTITVHEGWNLISLPLNVPDFRATTLFPSAISRAFSFEGGYIMKDTLEAETGYWLKFAQNEQITLIGSLQQEYGCSLRTGWNMMGSFHEKIAVNKLESDFCGIVTSNYYGYDSGSGYVKADTLEPGKGYWVKANQQGNLFEQKWIKVAGIYNASVTVNPVEPNILYAGTPSDFSAGRNGAILKSTDWGATWDTLVRNVDAYKVVLDPKNPDVGYASLGVANGCIPGILKTTNDGFTWFHADSGIYLDWEKGVGRIMIDPKDSEILYTETGGIWGSMQYKSTDGGKSWLPLIRYDSLDCSKDTLCWFGYGVSMAIDPNNSNVLYAVTFFLSNLNILFSSTSGGSTWEILYRFPVSIFGRTTSIYVDLQDSNILYLVGQGFFKSTDRGQSWQNSDSGLPNPISPYIHISKNNFTIYAAPTDGKIFSTTDKGVTWQSVITEADPIFYLQDLDESNGYIYSTKVHEFGQPPEEDGIYKLKLCK